MKGRVCFPTNDDEKDLKEKLKKQQEAMAEVEKLLIEARKLEEKIKAIKEKKIKE